MRESSDIRTTRAAKRSDSIRESLFLRDEGLRAGDSGLPPDVVAQFARRLRVLALLYVFIFFMAGYFPSLLSPGPRAHFFSSVIHWGPGAVSIAVAILVVGLTSRPRIPVDRLMLIGHGFQIASSFGIAAAEFLDPASIDFNARWVGLSWVAVWVLLFTVVVPGSPRRTVMATVASVSSVPLVIGFVVVKNAVPGVTWDKFFFGLIFPYLLIVLMAYVGARVIYALGREVSRARALGGYRLVERLGAGGMGEVWRAKHHLLARPAAIKLVRPEFHGGEAVRQRQLQERLGREAQATAMMRSPHTIELYDFGVANDGTFYYVMELLDGFDLDSLVTRFGPIPAERAIHLLLQVCHSLGEAHEEGLIHRDVKPANVYACRYGREVDYVKVLDFGIVKSQHESEDPDAVTRLTGPQAVCGTPAFMSPEQVLGNRPVDGRTDIYAVGCLAYWLVTGQQVFTGRTMEVLMQHTQAVPVPPSARSTMDVGSAFDAIVLSCLAKSPEDRPPSADALAEALRAIPASSSWTPSRARHWWEEHLPRAGGAGNGRARVF